MKEIEYHPMQIAKEWFEHGKKKDGKDPSEVAFRFISFWIAFNAYYAADFDYKHDSRIKEDCKDKKEYYSESELIKMYLMEKREYFNDLFDFDNEPELAIFRENPVFKVSSSPFENFDYKDKVHISDESKLPKGTKEIIKTYQTFIDTKESKIERLKALVLTINQVRNNMFHGGKTPTPERNYNLVDSSQWVIGKILKKLEEKEKYISKYY